MTTKLPTEPEDRGLWRRFDAESPPTEFDDAALIDLAAWLDGSSDDDTQERVERLLAASPAACRIVAGARNEEEIQDQAPRQLICSAQNLVGEPVGSKIRTSAFWIRSLSRGLAAAACIGICIIGYRTGLGFSNRLTPKSNLLVTEMSFGVIAAESATFDDAMLAYLANIDEEPGL